MAELTALSLRGAPGTTFGMSVTAGEGPGALTALFNVSVAPCAALEQYNAGAGQCGCLRGFVQNTATGACQCPGGSVFEPAPDASAPASCRLPPTRRFGKLSDGTAIGIIIGCGAFVLCAVTIAASEYSRRVERHLWQDELASEKELLRALQSRLAAAEGEGDVADSSLDMLRKLYPAACGVAVAIFAEGGKAEVSLCKTHASTVTGSKALQAVLPTPQAMLKAAALAAKGGQQSSDRLASSSERGGMAGTPDASVSGAVAGLAKGSLPSVAELTAGGKPLSPSDVTSVVWVNERQTVADSRDFADGCRAFPDWAQASGRGGLKSQRAITAPITAGPVTLGVVVLHFPSSKPGRSERSLLEFCKAVGGALFVRRTLVGIVYDGTTAPSEPTSREGNHSRELSRVATTSSSASRKHTTSGRSMEASFLNAKTAALDDSAAWEMLDAEAGEMRARLSSWTLDAWALDNEDLCRLSVRCGRHCQGANHPSTLHY